MPVILRPCLTPFQWVRPPYMDRRLLTASARMEAALAMEAEVTQRDRLIRTLAAQLRKSNDEKYRLVTQLDG